MSTDNKKYFANKYRIASARLQNWDYGTNAAYFLTICTKNREHYFGEIADAEMQLSEIGLLTNKFWFEIPQHFPFVKLGAFVVMPNHIHGIIVIDKPDGGGAVRRDAINRVSTNGTQPGGITGNKNPMLNENLSKIIRWYKGRVTYESHQIHADFAWQSRFYDHIIRNDKSFQTITDYIENNVLKWSKDKFNTSTIK